MELTNGQRTAAFELFAAHYRLIVPNEQSLVGESISNWCHWLNGYETALPPSYCGCERMREKTTKPTPKQGIVR